MFEISKLTPPALPTSPPILDTCFNFILLFLIYYIKLARLLPKLVRFYAKGGGVSKSGGSGGGGGSFFRAVCRHA